MKLIKAGYFIFEKMNSTPGKFAGILVNSTVYYLLAYFIIYFFFQLVTAFTASYFDIPAILYHNKVLFIVDAHSWTFDSVKMVFSSGCTISLVFGLVGLVVFIKAMTLEGVLKLLFFWIFVHGLNMFVGSIVLGAFIYEGMGYVYEWMYFKETERMLLLFLGLLIILGTGSLLVKPMYLSANSYFNSSRQETRRAFKLQQFIYPYLISTIIIIFIRFPLSIYELLLIITPGFILIPLFLGFHRNTIFFFDEKEKSIRYMLRPMVVTIIALVAFRILLGIGIRIG
ncbi:MAG: hypothetical protein IPH45_01260 [Bacteroidales bacterium]|nr:hypothetical protein [Bacteroidales bacterium]